MIKMGVYGLLRVGLDLLGGGPAWWGGLVLAAGAVSALLGVLYALMEHDLKRLLAYHSVENIGIIFIGLGAGLMFQSYGLGALAALGFVGGLYHTLNHACFKSLLFLGAGSVLHATGSRNMEELGGLIKRMPRTGFYFLVGAAAISALPPLNGFVSEWLVFQALLGGAAVPQSEVAVLMPVAVALLALTSGLAAACFVKAFGITFLGIPRSSEAEHAHEAPRSMQSGMAFLAAACVALGLGAFVMVPALGRVLAGHGGLPVPSLQPPGAARGVGRLRPDVTCAPVPWPRSAAGGDTARSPALRRGPGAPSQRYLGMRAHRADAADAVHRDRVCRAAPPRLRGALSADGGPHHRRPSRVAVLRAVHRIPDAHHAVVRAVSLRAGHRLGEGLGGARARHPVRVGPRVSELSSWLRSWSCWDC